MTLLWHSPGWHGQRGPSPTHRARTSMQIPIVLLCTQSAICTAPGGNAGLPLECIADACQGMSMTPQWHSSGCHVQRDPSPASHWPTNIGCCQVVLNCSCFGHWARPTLFLMAGLGHVSCAGYSHDTKRRWQFWPAGLSWPVRQAMFAGLASIAPVLPCAALSPQAPGPTRPQKPPAPLQPPGTRLPWLESHPQGPCAVWIESACQDE